ncbi:GNAT family N-acetyltransferase [Amphibacillus xylanus]|uniref:Putative acetyltransferase n=1 Tax=Amphibacillus xylanus (strain ATCC 51415 / DSM 6626 / JCM 7361 / LMG 17667 / NBRC 15112 / Ep01) TaxID=698758 RepID=K0J6J6_AMPXN|nr:GNAT family N-acetyltransferase [Amphibacillus xylanus]BAM46703.1 putative acetyltransferase [Amphibacillus xylanus NBRC 15112]
MGMSVTLKAISDSRRYPQLVEWYYKANPISHQLGYGRFAKRIIQAHLSRTSPLIMNHYLKGIFIKQSLVGFLIVYPISDRFQIEQHSFNNLKAHMNRLSYFRRIRFYRKVAHILNSEINDDYYYLHSLVIDKSYRNQGIGSEVIDRLMKKYSRIALYVNEKNYAAIQFYFKNGFKPVHHGQFRYKGDYYGEYLMCKEASMKNEEKQLLKFLQY